MFRWTLIITIACVWLGYSSCYAWALDGNDARRLHVLIVADTSDEQIGSMVDLDGRHLYELLVDEIPEVRRGPITVLKGKSVTQGRLFEAIEKLEVGPDDSVFCYFSGHGAYVSERGQVLRMADGGLTLRAELLKQLKDRGARLTVLITDACSSVVPSNAFPSYAMPEGIDHDVCRYLFFRHRGVVDIHAASPGEEAVALREQGSIFTCALIQQLQMPNAAFRGVPISWREVMASVAEATAFRFEAERKASRDFRLLFPNQTTQTVKVASLGETIATPIPKVAWRLGIRVNDTDGSGVMINTVYPNSQAEWAGIQPGEILYRVETGNVNPRITHIRTTSDIMTTFWSKQYALEPAVHKFFLSNPQERVTRIVKVRIRDINVR